jgi:hypothetical protein
MDAVTGGKMQNRESESEKKETTGHFDNDGIFQK